MAVRSRNGSAEMKGERGKWRALIIFYVRIKAILQSGRRIGDVHKNKSRSPTFDGALLLLRIFFASFPLEGEDGDDPESFRGEGWFLDSFDRLLSAIINIPFGRSFVER
ncbi:hypothetical protein CEXT_531121 [Caerostris extrusa]|uniref:Uncharacterized protein n=1 Tax=Caerostris extrusa TaxID=172846 RepID=A0AAV4XF44_CAEEX|nr:hypothetical protein CEXT_531121 [Caerostris extrusa]